MEKEVLRKNIMKEGEKFGYVFSKDKKRVGQILDLLLMKKEKAGEHYCPCRVLTGDKKKDEEIICVCKPVRLKKEDCKCGLFVKKE